MTPRRKYILREAEDYLFITFGLMLMAFGWSVFLLPNEIVTGGVTGISAIVYYATGIEVQVTYLLINAAFLIAAIKVLGWSEIAEALRESEELLRATLDKDSLLYGEKEFRSGAGDTRREGVCGH